jgi:hypothetical protein
MEVEADRKGMELILAANIDPHGMIRIFEKLTQDESSQEEEIKNKTVSRKKDTDFFLTFPPIRQVRIRYSIYKSR